MIRTYMFTRVLCAALQIINFSLLHNRLEINANEVNGSKPDTFDNN